MYRNRTYNSNYYYYYYDLLIYFISNLFIYTYKYIYEFIHYYIIVIYYIISCPQQDQTSEASGAEGDQHTHIHINK